MNYDVTKVSEELHVRPEILSRLVTSFAKTLSDKIASLEEAVPKDDVLKMRAILHEIRGTSGNLRLEDIANAGRIMHEAVKSGKEKEKIPDYFKTLKEQAEALTAFVTAQEK